MKYIFSHNTSRSNNNMEFILKLHLSIIASQSCGGCSVKTLDSIKNKLMPFNIPLQDGSSLIVTIQNPDVTFSKISEAKTTTEGNLIIHFSYII